MKNRFSLLIVIFLCTIACGNATSSKDKQQKIEEEGAKVLKVGAENTNSYLPLLKGKTIAVVTNHTAVLRLFNAQDSVVGQQHLVDFLVAKGVKVQAIFAPEHGFRGKEDAGAKIENDRDSKTGLPIYSLHGKYKKPQPSQLSGVELVVFDIQDVGVRFYTYISTLHYVMVACAEQGIPLVVLDRPNPNGHFIDGPVMEEKFQSFLGMHPVPVVYGMTIGEYAQMIEGEAWLPNKLSCKLTVVKLKNWKHTDVYILPIKPSPNLPNQQSINLYPSLCFFEQTDVSIGRGTLKPFQLYGGPNLKSDIFNYHFIPKSMEGAQQPKHKGVKCYGEDLQNYTRRLDRLELKWLIKAYNNTKFKNKFFKKNIELLTGTSSLRIQIQNGWAEDRIRESWQKDMSLFKNVRKKYLLYPDFE